MHLFDSTKQNCCLIKYRLEQSLEFTCTLSPIYLVNAAMYSIAKCHILFFLVSADLENIDDGLESLCLSVTEHALSGEWLVFVSPLCTVREVPFWCLKKSTHNFAVL